MAQICPYEYEEDRPPGTIRLQDNNSSLSTDWKRSLDGEIILNPQPSSDPNDPLNWTAWQKTFNFILVNYFTVIVWASLSVSTVLWGPFQRQLGFTNDELTLSYAMNEIGLTIGCVLFIPFALIFGRKPVYLATTLVIFATNIWQANQSTVFDLYGSQLLSGLAGATSETLIQLTVSDMFFVHERGTMNGIYTGSVVFGSFVLPIAAGYIANSLGWRWCFWFCAIATGLCFVLFLFCYEDTKYQHCTATADRVESSESPSESKQARAVESSSPKSLKRKTYIHRMRAVAFTPGSTIRTYLYYLSQPFVLFFRVPAIAFVALQYGFAFSWVSVLSVTMSSAFIELPYSFSPVGIGNLNIAPCVGAFFGIIYGGIINDKFAIRMAKRNHGVFEPEMRLHMLSVPAIITPIGLWLYGYSVSKGMHWIIPCVAFALVGYGLGAVISITLTYLTDSYQESKILGNGLIAVAFLRNGLATIFVVITTTWEESMGFNLMFIIIAILCFVVLACYIIMIYYGKRGRKASLKVLSVRVMLS